LPYKNDDYRPNKRSREILARGWEHMQSIPYRATSRWLFYRLLQDGLYKAHTSEEKKREYQKFLSLTSRARHNSWEGWRPDSLTDDTRNAIRYDGDGGCRSVQEWATSLREESWIPVLDHWYQQQWYAEVWFEAEAMRAQFEHYVKGLTLRPFKGMPSIDYKYKIAQDLAAKAQRYDLPVAILYFGDYDKSGLTIPETSVADIRSWCEVPFEFERCGLNAGDGNRLGIPENFEKPGTYQWEALPDDAARGLIVPSVERVVDTSVFPVLEAQAQEAGQKLCVILKNFTL